LRKTGVFVVELMRREKVDLFLFYFTWLGSITLIADRYKFMASANKNGSARTNLG